MRLKYEPPPIQPVGVYPARLNEIEIKDSDDGKKYLKWHFASQTRKGQPHTFRDNSSFNFGPKSKPREWVQVLLGRTLSREEAKEGVDLDELVNDTPACQLLIGVVTKEDGAQYNRIDAVLPLAEDDDEEDAEADVA
jgi:hypothetical protein